MTIFVSPEIYLINQTVTLKPVNRLTIRAEILMDDPEWNTDSMPTLIHTMPLSENQNDRKAPFVGVAHRFQVEASHVTIKGLKILKIPVMEHPKNDNIQSI